MRYAASLTIVAAFLVACSPQPEAEVPPPANAELAVQPVVFDTAVTSQQRPLWIRNLRDGDIVLTVTKDPRKGSLTDSDMANVQKVVDTCRERMMPSPPVAKNLGITGPSGVSVVYCTGLEVDNPEDGKPYLFEGINTSSSILPDI